jgi:hypothetical protein
MRRLLVAGVGLCLGAFFLPVATGAAGAATTPAATPTLTATPSTGLLDGQQIQVSASGLVPDAEYGVIECQTGASDISG